MTNETKKPEFKADGIAVWQSTDKNNNPYLYIKLVGHAPIRAFFNKEVEKHD